MARLSGLQKDVLALYRSILREAMRKDRQEVATLLPPSSVPSTPQQAPCTRADVTKEDDADAAAATPIHRHHHHLRHSLPFAPTTHASTNNNETTTNATTLSYARSKFRQEANSVRRSDFKTIEYKIRKGKKQLELLRMPGVIVVGGV
jgi:hypothetical protein